MRLQWSWGCRFIIQGQLLIIRSEYMQTLQGRILYIRLHIHTKHTHKQKRAHVLTTHKQFVVLSS